MVEFEILERKAYKEIPPRVEYFLTEKGKKVFPILDEIVKFFERDKALKVRLIRMN